MRRISQKLSNFVLSIGNISRKGLQKPHSCGILYLLEFHKEGALYDAKEL